MISFAKIPKVFCIAFLFKVPISYLLFWKYFIVKTKKNSSNFIVRIIWGIFVKHMFPVNNREKNFKIGYRFIIYFSFCYVFQLESSIKPFEIRNIGKWSEISAIIILECISLLSLLNRVPCMPACQRGLRANVLACQRGLRAKFSSLRAIVPTCHKAGQCSTWRANVPKSMPIFQTFFLRNAKGNLHILLYKKFYIILDIILVLNYTF